MNPIDLTGGPASSRRRSFRRVVLVGVAVLVAIVLAIGVTVLWRQFGAASQAVGEPVPIQSAELGGSGPGSLVSAVTMPALSATPEGGTMRAARITYRSTSGDTGAETVVTGSVFVPYGEAPEGGWPVVSFGHGTTGLDEPCAPSLSDTLLGGVPMVAGFIHSGYAVAYADYQGLGAPGVHPYTDARSAGRNMIDAVRALRHTFPDVSARWAAVGGSQGGGAAWSADEQAATYAPELDLVGAVALVPAADVSGVVDKAAAGTMGRDQQLAFIAIVESLARLHPELDRDDFRHGPAAEHWPALTACAGPLVAQRDGAAAELRPADTVPATPAAADEVRRLLSQWAIPQQRLSAPLVVVYGDSDEFIDVQWTTAAIARACALGGDVTGDLQAGKGHGDVDVAAQVQWLADRFAGKPVASGCA